jgi:CYTH domain-containing protein
MAFLDVYQTSNTIAQGYLNSNPERTVRIRIKSDKGFLTIKGIGNASGATRFEWEKEIPISEAKVLLTLCEEGIIEKTRYEVVHGKHTIEIDVFHGSNEGLVLAEIELKDENEAIEKPNWIGKEVTQDVRYYNSYLSLNPFKNW